MANNLNMAWHEAAEICRRADHVHRLLRDAAEDAPMTDPNILQLQSDAEHILRLAEQLESELAEVND